jgi:DNA mismatch repair protein MutS
MIFDIDKQTVRDLELFNEKKRGNSIYNFYKKTATIGGQEALYEMINVPVSDYEFLKNRKDSIRFFLDNNCFLKLQSRQIDYIEFYLRNRRFPLRDNIIDATYNGLSNKFSPDSDYHVISEGVFHIVQFIKDLIKFIKEVESLQVSSFLDNDCKIITKVTSSKTITEILKHPAEKIADLSYSRINKLDRFFRVSNKDPFRELLNIVYKIDVLQTLSGIVKNDGFALADYVAGSKTVFEVTEGFHPFLDLPVSNSFCFKNNSSLCFITGPNMSGKSTFLKTMGLMIYLSHIGFPVPAKQLRTSIFGGLFTTINLTDNLNLGYSHFYSEVKRVKDIVIKINSSRNLCIIFDELFRGTNVKDAYDASLMIIKALARIHDNLFFISTHILEVAENIDNKDTIMFRCFESDLVGQQPVYDYKIKEGISKERIGLLIIQNEQIPGILDEIVRKQNSRLEP